MPISVEEKRAFPAIAARRNVHAPNRPLNSVQLTIHRLTIDRLTRSGRSQVEGSKETSLGAGRIEVNSCEVKGKGAQDERRTATDAAWSERVRRMRSTRESDVEGVSAGRNEGDRWMECRDERWKAGRNEVVPEPLSRVPTGGSEVRKLPSTHPTIFVDE